MSVKAARLALSDSMSVEQAFQAIAFNCLAQMRGNEDGVANGDDVESLHQMRVGMRRLRSALGMFKDLLRLPGDLRRELDWLAKELGVARDWDVLAGSTLPALAKQLVDPKPIGGLRRAASGKAKEQRASAAAAVGSRRYIRLMRNLARWVQTTGWRDDRKLMAAGAPLAQPVKKFARKILKRDQRRLRARAANLRAATPEARHRVRIAAKKTRYAAEFFESLFASGSVRPYIKVLSRLQEELGRLNDAAVAERLLTEMAAGQPQLKAGAGYARGYLAARAKKDGKAIIKRWKKFARVDLPH
jgi:triphosphatase